MNLPTHEQSKVAVLNNKATALHKFIYENEPANQQSSALFRKELEAVIEEHCLIDRKVIDKAFEAVDLEYCTLRNLNKEEITLEEVKNRFLIANGFIKQ